MSEFEKYCLDLIRDNEMAIIDCFSGLVMTGDGRLIEFEVESVQSPS